MLSVQTTEDWVGRYLSQSLVLASLKAEEQGFFADMGGDLFGFTTYILLTDMEDHEYEKCLVGIISYYCKDQNDVRFFYNVFSFVLDSAKTFLQYVKNSQAEDWLRNHELIRTWQRLTQAV